MDEGIKLYWLPVLLTFPYIVLILKIYRSLLNIKIFNLNHDPVTFISVVIACRNEQENLPRLLKSILIQTYPEELYEVIIVDDNSTDKTHLFATEFTKTTGNVHIIKNIGSGKKQAIRTGIDRAAGKLIITTDADCIMEKGWIRIIAAFYEQEKASMIVCPVRIDNMPGFFGKFQSLEFLSLQGITAGTVSSGKGTMCNGANLAFEKEVYLKHSDELHDEVATGDDVFLLHSLKSDTKAKILWLESPDAIVTTAPSKNLKAYFNQRKRWISKAGTYTDKDSILLGIVTFVTILVQVATLIAIVTDPFYFWIFLLIFMLKSVPDFLILLNTTQRYGNSRLMMWFLPAQAVYPLYVLGVLLYSISGRKN